MSSRRLTSAARAAADYLCATVFEGKEDAVWVGLQGQGERYWAISTLGLDLYGGAPGIALFLAHAGEVLQENRYTDLARESLRHHPRAVGLGGGRMVGNRRL